MTDLDVDDLEVFADDTDENYARISKKDLESLRGAAKGASKSRRELETMQREKACVQAGLTDLNADQLETLALIVKDTTPEALKAKALALGFIKSPEVTDGPSDEELAAHAQAAQVSNGAGTPTSTQATPEDANSWPVDKLMRLQQAHPDTYELLLRGEKIQLPAGFQ